MQIECNTHFPIVNGTPVLLNEKASIFSISDLVSSSAAAAGEKHQNKLKKLVYSFVPSLSKNIKAAANYKHLSELLSAQTDSPRILIIGCGEKLGDGIEVLVNHPALELVETDVAFSSRTALICDGHDIPFEDGAFDAVVIQAVLCYVVDPYRCVDEIHRVLNKQGVVYAETPFVQQVHGGQYDFTRFTHLGHRRLFRRFEEIDSGAVCGPGMALGRSYQYFLMSFVSSTTTRTLMRIFSRLSAFYLKYFDLYLIDKPAALDAASGCYFLGRKSDQVLSDRDLIKQYRGAQ